MPKVDHKRKEVVQAEKDWCLIADCIEGERAVKEGGEKYLPKPAAEKDEEYARKRYKAYKTRAVFYNVTGRTLEGLVGQVFSKDSSVELPDTLERYEPDLDGAGTPLEQQAKATLKATLSFGHCGLLADFPTIEEGRVVTLADIEALRIRPRVLLTQPKDIINWRVSVVGGETLLSLVVLEETAVVKDDGFQYETEPRWREIRLQPANEEGTEFAVTVTLWRKKEKPVNEDDKFETLEGYPVVLSDYKGNTLDRIPFEFVGATNNEPQIDKAPLLDLATLNIAHFRNSADYEEGVFMTGQDQLVLSGLTQEWVDKNFKGGIKLGSRAAITLPKDASADLLHADPNSIAAEAMKHKEEQMKALGAKLIEPKATKGTATEALIEESSESSVLSSAAKNVSQAYRKALFHASRFIGEVNPEDIDFELNSDFAAAMASPAERAQIVAEWQSGLITFNEAREQLRKAGIAYEDDDVAKTLAEETLIPPPGSGSGGDE
jgi:hypothetical protein